MKKKIKCDLKGFFNKKENMALFAVAVIFCAGIAITNIRSSEIPLHNGDVLVDSASVSGEENERASGDSPKSFKDLKALLELERQDLISKYDEIIKNSPSKPEKKNAGEQKEKLLSYMEKEISAEGLIRAKGLPDCLVIITDNRVTVTVDDKNLNQNTVAKICHIVMEETDRGAEDIVIQSKH